ncbi:MAG: glycosyltransferase [Longimicrobiales bacterium]|nr:glycosyltransferase [Longimicrobiales bacterium]
MSGSGVADAVWALLWGVNVLVLGYFLLLNGVYLLTTLAAFRALRRYPRRLKTVEVEELMRTAGALPVSLVVPAYNEGASCVEATRALLTLRYPDYHILFVNDGSTDETLERMVAAYEMEPAPLAPTAGLATGAVRGIWRSRRNPNLWLIDKENGGKADAQNAGLNYCRTPLFGAIDADSLLEPDAVTRVVRAFLEDARTVAAGGVIRIVNGCAVRAGQVVDVRLPRNLLARFQVLEYLRAFLSGRMGWDALGAPLIISGAFGIFHRATVVEAGGFDRTTVGEDMELTVRLHRHCRARGVPYRIRFVPDPVAWTECPEDVRSLGRQRDRWQRGLMESMWRHRTMLLNPRYGAVGLLAYPYFFFLEMLGPVIEAVGFVAFAVTVLAGGASAAYVGAFLGVAVLLGMALSLAAVGLEELTFRRYTRTRSLVAIFGLAILENLGYRQLNAYWRIRGFITKLRGGTGWGDMRRRGFGTGAGNGSGRAVGDGAGVDA